MASHRRPAPPGLVRVGRVTVLCAAAAAAMSISVPAGAVPRERPDDVGSRVGEIYARAEQATQDYDAAQQKETELRGRLETLRGELARDQRAVNRTRDSLAVVAGARYRENGIDPTLTLLLTDDPDSYLDRAALLDRVEGRRAGRLRQLRAGLRAVDRCRRQAVGDLAELDRVRRRAADRKRAVQAELGDARLLLDTLTPARRAAIGLGPAAGPGPDLPYLPPSSGRAAEAVAAVRAALGSPYVWGSTGPASFDCSGLTYWAYRHAGVTLPRTSQGQSRAGQRVPLDQARPGDLVVYRADASHVAMYVGGGKVIHAPHPGARVRYDRVDMMPIDSVVRP